MFTIYTQPNKAPSAVVYIDSNVPIAVPKSIGFGVGNKKDKYKTWLKESNEKRPNVYYFLVKLYEAAEEKGALSLLAKTKSFPWQAQALREFFVENGDLLKMLVPYYKQMAEKGQGDQTMPDGEGETMSTVGKQMTLGDLPEEERDQILKLIQEQEARLDAGLPPTVPHSVLPAGPAPVVVADSQSTNGLVPQFPDMDAPIIITPQA